MGDEGYGCAEMADISSLHGSIITKQWSNGAMEIIYSPLSIIPHPYFFG
jgi:hypothetical protein